MPNYRIIVQYDPSRSVFHARAPELSHIGGEGPTRSEALARLEEEIAAQLANAREGGGAVVPAIDDASPEDDAFGGDIAAKVSRNLHRELAFQARAEGVELTALLGELLAQGLEIRRQLRRRPAASAPLSGAGPDESRPGPGTGNDRRPPYRGGNQGGRYHAIMEDRATFLEYVRGLESGNAPPRNRGDRRRGPAGGGGGRGRGGGSDGTPGNEGGAG